MSDSKCHDFSLLCRHCDQETTTPVPAEVTGCIPPYAHGSYLFNGPGLTRFGDAEYQLCFDSSAVIQKISVSGSGCSYSSRYLRSETFARNTAASSIVVPEMGTAGAQPQRQGLLARMKKMADTEAYTSDNASVMVTALGGRHYALGESPFMHQLDLDSLHVKNKRNLREETGLVNVSPHPFQDGKGNSFLLGQGLTLTGPKYTIVKVPNDGSPCSVLCRITPRWRLSPCYVHSVGATDRYAVVLEQPMTVSMTEAVKKMVAGQPFSSSIKWHPEEDTIIHVIDLDKGTALRSTFVCDALFMLHSANCYEDAAGDVVLDFPCYVQPVLPGELTIAKLRNMSESDSQSFCKRFSTSFKRLVLPVATKHNTAQVRVELQTLCSTGFECPIVNPNYKRKKHRYVYGAGIDAAGASNRSQVYKLDVETGDMQVYGEDDLYASDPMFVPNPAGQREEDGVLVSLFLVSSRPQEGRLVVLDASSLSPLATATFTSPAPVLKPVHSSFFSSQELEEAK